MDMIEQLASRNQLLNGLLNAQAYNHEVDAIQVIETHISWVLLTGRYAYKIKKPVYFGFLDFSSLEKRRLCCQEELRLNQRLAKTIYLSVVPITGNSTCPKIGGTDHIIEYAVKMRQFPSGQLLSEIAALGQLGQNEIDQLADIVADFHQNIPKANDASPYGHAEAIKHWFDENFTHIFPYIKDERIQQQLHAVSDWSQQEWLKRADYIALRKQQGFVRECHGDLHLSNITLLNGQPCPFDCIEFNPMLRWIDVISEVAFLWMDLCHLDYTKLAFRFLNRYLQQTGDYQGLALLPYYVVYRALVRAKVAVLRMQQYQSETYTTEFNHFTQFICLAEQSIAVKHPMILLTHGFSGSGKSYFSSQLAEIMGAIHLRSDVERKRLFGYSKQANTHSSLHNGIYSEAAHLKTYHHLAELVASIVTAGFSVIVDATFLKCWQRDLFKQLAAQYQIKYFILDFSVATNILQQRILQRQHDASEATLEVLEHQQSSAEALTAQEQNVTVSIHTDQNIISVYNALLKQ